MKPFDIIPTLIIMLMFAALFITGCASNQAQPMRGVFTRGIK